MLVDVELRLVGAKSCDSAGLRALQGMWDYP